MKNYSNSGHTVLATELTSQLPESVRKEYLQAIEDGDTETVGCILGDNWPGEFPDFEDVFNVSHDEIENEDLEEGMFVQFSADDLYVKSESVAMKAMKAAGLNPTPAQWVTYS